MTFFALCLLVFVANLIVYREAAVLVPFTGILFIVSCLRLLYITRRKRLALRKAMRTEGVKGRAATAPNGRGMAARNLQNACTSGDCPVQAQQGIKKRKKGKDKEAVDVQRQGNVLYASFPSTKEGRRRALEAFSKEKAASAEKEGQPLQ